MFADSPATELSSTLTQLEHFSAEFNQVTTDANGNEIQRTSGHLWITKPRKFRSHTYPPMEQLLVSDGDLLWYFDPDLEQVTIQKLDLISTNQPAFLLAGQIDDIDSHFMIEYYQDEEAQHYVLRPRQKDSTVSALVLEIRQGAISAIEVFDALKQRTAIQFSALETNTPIDPATYHLDIPEGVDVVKEF